MLPHADKEQCAAFIVSSSDPNGNDLTKLSEKRDERVLVVWSESIEHIVPACHDIEEKLIKLLWRSRPARPASANASYLQPGQGNSAAPSIADGSTDGLATGGGSIRGFSRVGSAIGLGGKASGFNFFGDLSDQDGKERTDQKSEEIQPSQATATRNKSFWNKLLGRTKSEDRDLEALNPSQRPAMLYAPLYNGIAAGLSFGLCNVMECSRFVDSTFA